MAIDILINYKIWCQTLWALASTKNFHLFIWRFLDQINLLVFWSLSSRFLVRKHKTYLHYLSVLGIEMTGSWNLSSWKMGSNLSYIINTMAADDLATHGARVSATIVLCYFSRNITFLVPEVRKAIMRSCWLFWRMSCELWNDGKNHYFLTLNMQEPSYLNLTWSISCFWWPGSLCHQAISSHDIDYVI